MNKIESLINKLCPNCVEYKSLDTICSVNTGTQLNKEKLLENAKYPVINGGINPSGYWNEYNTEKNTITISQGGASAGFVNYMETPFWAGAHCYIVKLIDNNVNYRYLYHFIKSIEKKLQQCQQGAGIPSISRKTIYENCIPVPPMEVQNEIVHILDDFTLLSAELSAELKAREKQYEYYKNKLFNFSDEVETIEFGELCEIVTKQTGFDYSKSIKDALVREYKTDFLPYIQTKFFEGKKFNYNTDYYIPRDVAEKFPKILLNQKAILLSIVGASIGNVGLFDGNKECFLGGAICVAKVLPEYNIDYIYYYLTSINGQKQIFNKVKGAGQATVTIEDIRNFIIPMPKIELQNEIVRKIEKFDAITNDILNGLPAEIEARQKQYEYYRDKLLSFKELKVEE